MAVADNINHSGYDRHQSGHVNENHRDAAIWRPRRIEIAKRPAVEKNHGDGHHLQDRLGLAEDIGRQNKTFAGGDEAESVDDQVAGDHQKDAKERDGEVIGAKMWQHEIEQRGVD